MSKLIFEDDNGKQFNIKLDTVKTVSMKDSDVVVATYEVGTLSPKDSNVVLQQLNDVIKGFFPNNRVLTLASRNGTEDVSLKIMSEKNIKE